METVLAVVVVFAVLGIFVMGHPTSVIARKTDQSDTAEVLAYLPFLQFVPMIWAAGGQVWRFLLLTVAVAGSCVLMGVAADALGDGAIASVMGFYADWAIDVYLLGWTAWLGWRIALNRDLPGAFGLLLVLPLFNILATWVLAFHDGWGRPHRGGMAAGVALVLVFALPIAWLAKDLDEETIQAKLAEWGEAQMLEQMAELEAAESGSDGLSVPNAAASPEPTPPAAEALAEQQDRSIHALYELKGRFETLDGLTSPENMRIQDLRVRALGLVRNIRTDLEALHGDLDAATYGELANHLNRVEAELHYASNPAARRNGGLTITDRRDRASGQGAAHPAAPAPGARDEAPLRPFPVQVADDCPPGTELRSRTEKKREEEWCQQLAQYGGLRHGWYARYVGGGKPEQVGEYRDGLRVGVWTRFFPSGAVRAQAEFEAGLQHGWLLTFSEGGERKKAVRFAEGTAVR